MIFAADKYGKGKDKHYPMPLRSDENISPEEKESGKYNLAMAQAIYHEFCSGGTQISNDAYSSVEEYRSYAFGNQDNSRYINSFYGKSSDDTVTERLASEADRTMKRKAAANLNFDVQSPAPRLMDALIGKMRDYINSVSVDGIDPYSLDKKEDAKWGAWAEKQFQEQFNTIRALQGLPQPDMGFIPENKEELTLYEAEGGFRPSYVVAMERLLKYVFEQSRWDEYVSREVLWDLITNGFAAVRDVYDDSTGQVKVLHMDARTTGVQYCPEHGNAKPDFAFYVELVPLSSLRKKGFTQEQLNFAADKFDNYFGNNKFDDNNEVNKQYEDKYARQADKFLVPVFVANWIDVDYEKDVVHTNRYGRKKSRPYKEKSKLGKKDELRTTNVKVLREVHWIIDTDMIYDYGRVKNQARDGWADPVVPIRMVQVKGKPIIPRLIPVLDQYMMGWMKFQQGIRMAALNGFAIDMSILNNINLGSKKMNPKQVLKYWRESGILFFSSETIRGRQNMSTRPIEQLPGGAGAVMTEAVSVMDFAARQITELTGINPISIGEAPNPETGKAVTEFSIMGTNDILKNIIIEANVLKSDVARNACLRLQYVVKHDKRAKDVYAGVIGESELELLKIAEGHDVRYGIRTHARPTAAEKQKLEEAISLSLKNGRDGKVGITEADYVRFMFMLEAGESLKRIAMLLGAAHRKAQKEAEERAMRAQQLDQQGAQQLVAQKQQADTNSQMLKTQAEIAVNNNKVQGDILVKAVDKGELNWQQAWAMVNGQPMPQQPQAAPQAQQPQAPMAESGVPIEGVEA